MTFKNVFSGDIRGVSPVIGVILMVAITVILAATVGAFVMGMDAETERPPTASWDSVENGTEVTITHDGGEAATVETLYVRVEGNNGVETYAFANGSALGVGDEVSATDSVTVSVASTVPSPAIDATSEIGGNNLDNATAVELLWKTDGQSEVLHSWEP